MTLSEEYKTLNPTSKKSMYIMNVIVTVVLLAIIIGSYILIRTYSTTNIYIDIGTAVIAIALIAYCIVEPILFYNHYRYIVSSDRIDVRRGIIIIRRTLVPIERIHQVEVTRGPINNMFGLADVTVTTAGGTAKIQYLDKETAESIAFELNQIVNKMVRDQKHADQQ